MAKFNKILFRNEHIAIVRHLPNKPDIHYWDFWEPADKPLYVIAVGDSMIDFEVYRRVALISNPMSLVARMFPERYWQTYERIG